MIYNFALTPMIQNIKQVVTTRHRDNDTAVSLLGPHVDLCILHLNRQIRNEAKELAIAGAKTLFDFARDHWRYLIWSRQRQERVNQVGEVAEYLLRLKETVWTM